MIKSKEVVMKTMMLIFLALATFSTYALAGQIYGTIKNGSQPVSEGTEIVIAINGNNYSGITNQYGQYNIYVNETGQGRLIVTVSGQKQKYVNIYVFTNAARYDLDLYQMALLGG
jgi:hypothetical protein